MGTGASLTAPERVRRLQAALLRKRRKLRAIGSREAWSGGLGTRAPAAGSRDPAAASVAVPQAQGTSRRVCALPGQAPVE